MEFDKRWQHNQSFQNIFVIYHNWYLGTIFSTFFEAIPEYLVRLSQALPFFWMFYAFNPSKVWSNMRKKYPVSKPILAGYFILLFNGLVFLIPQQNVTIFRLHSNLGYS